MLQPVIERRHALEELIRVKALVVVDADDSERVGGGVDSDVDLLVSRMMAHLPDARFSSAGALAEDLEAAVQDGLDVINAANSAEGSKPF